MPAAHALRSPLGLAWLVLVGATLLSSVLGWGGAESDTAGAVILAVAFAKVYLVGDRFMEVRSSPLVLRAVFAGYCLVVGGGLIVLLLAL